MLLCFDELCRKEVIDIRTGERLGFIDDIELDIESGCVRSLVIYGGFRLFGLWGKGQDTVVSCSEIKVIGDDIVLVERSEMVKRAQSTNYGKKGFSSLLK